MGRTSKNIIVIALVVALSAAISLTEFVAYNEMTSASSSTSSQQGGTPPEMPNNNSSNSESQNSQSQQPGASGQSDSNSTSEPPAKPDGDSSSGSTQSDPGANANNNNSSSSSEPPAKPEGDSSNTTNENNSGNNNSNSGQNSQDPSANSNGSQNQQDSSSNSNGGQAQNQSAPQMPSQQQTSSTDMPIKYSSLLTLEGLLLGLVLAYLFASGFNKRKFGETFKNKANIAVVILSGLLALSIFGLGSSLVLQKAISSNTSSQEQQGMPGAQQSSNVTYSAIKEITTNETVGDETFTSSTANENAILATGSITSTLTGTKIEKSGDSDGGDATSFYGNNSGILAKDGATLNVDGATINTNATGANGIFSYGGSATTQNSSSDGTTVNISNSKISTSKDNSGGIMTTGGGIMNARNLLINTSGTSSAAIRTDRGGGTVSVDGGTYTTTGKGSPSIYSTANVTVSNATLNAEASEGVCIEGKNTVNLENVTLTDSNTQLNGQSTTYKNIFLYQSMSGDADSGTSKFSAKNSKVTTNKGDTLYVTNTTAEFDLENNEFVNNDSTGNFLRVQADSWGKSGSNGGDVTLNLTNQKVSGNIVIDSISTLKMTLASSSYYEGAINTDNSAKSISLKLDSSSKLKLTEDCYVTSLENADSTNSNIDFNGFKLFVNGTAIN